VLKQVLWRHNTQQNNTLPNVVMLIVNVVEAAFLPGASGQKKVFITLTLRTGFLVKGVRVVGDVLQPTATTSQGSNTLKPLRRSDFLGSCFLQTHIISQNIKYDLGWICSF
jgi:hypothetical protein